MKKEIPFNIDKQKALKIIKKAATQKFAIVSDNGFTFKIGSPGMTATIEVLDNMVSISASGFGTTIGNTAVSDIESALEDAGNESNSSTEKSTSAETESNVSKASLDDHFKIIEILKAYKELLDSGVLTQEEFDAKKTELLNYGGSKNLKASQEEHKSIVEKPIIKTESEEIVDNKNPEEKSSEEIAEVSDNAGIEKIEEIYEKGKLLFNEEKKYAEAYECFLEAAPYVQAAKFNLANLYYLKGYDGRKDKNKAVQLLQELADEGYEKAIKALKTIH